jgi:hypothetical protein
VDRVALGPGALELLELLVEVLVEAVALDDEGVGLVDLVAVEVYEEGLDVVDELVQPWQVQEGSVDGLGVLGSAHVGKWQR